MAEYGIRWISNGTTTLQPCAEIAIDTIKSWAECGGVHNELMVRADALSEWEPSPTLPTYDDLLAEVDRLRQRIGDLEHDRAGHRNWSDGRDLAIRFRNEGATDGEITEGFLGLWGGVS